MKHRVNLGVVCLARKTFDFEAARKIYHNLKQELSQRSDVHFTFIDDLVIESDDAISAADKLAGSGIDALVCMSGTFHLGHLVLEIAKRIRKPILLWGLNELPYDGGKIRLNSVCGVNLNASNLYKSGLKNYHVHIGDEINEDWIDAIRVDSCLSTARIGILGFRAHGFFNLGVYDLDLYKEMGPLIDYYDPAELLHHTISDDEFMAMKQKVTELFDITQVSAEQVMKVAELAAKFKGFITKNKLSALAVRCWPEFAANFGIAPCAAMSIVGSEGHIVACEGDVEGAISMLAQSAVGGQTPYLFDFSQIDFAANHALLWHCGVAPLNLWDNKSARALDSYFAGGRGVTADFVLREGQVSILRFDSAPGEKRMLLGRAEGLTMAKQLKGTYLKVRFARDVREVFNAIVENGIAHHASMVYGEFVNAFTIYAKIRGYKVVTM